jgi:DNA repair exonuclease SbcCD ATPase subunit
MKSKKILAKILHMALTDIRAEAKEVKNNKIFTIAQYLQNLPLKLSKAKTEDEYDAILADLEDMCKENAGMQSLVNQVKESRLQ